MSADLTPEGARTVARVLYRIHQRRAAAEQAVNGAVHSDESPPGADTGGGS